MTFFTSCCTICRPQGAADAPQTPLPAPGRAAARGGGPGHTSPALELAPAVERHRESQGPPLLPFTRIRKERSLLINGSSVCAVNSDGGTGGVPGDEGLAHQRSSTRERSRVPLGRSSTRRDSQLLFAQQEQTVIVLDWDDTLFPTTYINDDLRLLWQEPLHRQPGLAPEAVPAVQQKLSLCEEGALEVLNAATSLAHVVVVTLASTGWVDLACRHFYPAVGDLLRRMKIPVVYAQEKAGVTQTQYDKLEFQSNAEIERFWGLVKGRAISEEVDKFYSQYAGQSWKNILSIGDSSFERYGLLAATSAYMQGRPLTAEMEGAVWSPTQEGCWQSVQDGHVRKLRAKCCKLVDQPDVSELTVELGMISSWLDGMVGLDAGFDLDLETVEDEAQIRIIEEVLHGERPVSDLPRPNVENGLANPESD